MRTYNWIATIIIVFAGHSAAAFSVNVNSITDPNHIMSMAKQVANTLEQVRQGVEMINHAKTVLAYAGDPKAAVKSISDLANITAALDRILGPEVSESLKMGDIVDTMRASANLENSLRSLMSQTEVLAYGQRRQSTPTLYEALWAAEQMAGTVRNELNKHQQLTRDINTQMADAYRRLRLATTESERVVIRAEIDMLGQKLAMSARQMDLLKQQAENEIASDNRKRAAEQTRQSDQSDFESEVLANEIANERAKRNEALEKEMTEKTSTKFLRYDFGSVPTLRNSLPTTIVTE